MAGIAMFGPSGCGKTSVLHAFYWALANDVGGILSRGKMYLRFMINGQEYSLQHKMISSPAPTSNAETKEFIFGRVPKDPEDPAQQWSAHMHQILMVDNQGKFHTAALGYDQQDEANVYAANVLLELANSIFVLLDPTLLSNTPEAASSDYLLQDSQVTGLERRLFTQNEYARLVENLRQLPATTEEGFQRRIAICVAKVDQIGSLVNLDTNVLIRIKFGQDMEMAIRQLEEHFGPQNVRRFKFSAVGFDRDNTPNFDPAQGWLKDPNNWMPYKIHEPFIWIFQARELDLIRKKAAARSAAEKLFRSDREIENLYIPYMPG